MTTIQSTPGVSSGFTRPRASAVPTDPVDRFDKAMGADPLPLRPNVPTGPRAQLWGALNARYTPAQSTRILQIMGPVLDGGDARIAPLPAEQRVAALQALIETSPTLATDPQQAVETVPAVAEALYTGELKDVSIDYSHGVVHCTMQHPSPVALADDVRLYAEFFATEKDRGAKGPVGPDRLALDALRAQRQHFRGDREQVAAFRELLPTLGDPWTTVGAVRLLFTLPRADRQVLQAHFLKILDAARRSGNLSDRDESTWVLRMLSNHVLSASYRQPQEAIETFQNETDIQWKNAYELTMPSFENHPAATEVEAENELRSIIDAVGRTRARGESLDTSREVFADFYRKLGNTTDPETASHLYLLGLDARPALEQLQGKALTRDTAAQAVLDLVAWMRDNLKAENGSLSAAMDVALSESHGVEAVHENLKRCVNIYRITGDAATLHKFGQDVDRAIAAGTLPAESRSDILQQLEMEVYRQAALGQRREDLPSAAWKAVVKPIEQRSGPLAQQDRVQQGEDVVVIGGVSIPRRRTQD